MPRTNGQPPAEAVTAATEANSSAPPATTEKKPLSPEERVKFLEDKIEDLTHRLETVTRAAARKAREKAAIEATKKRIDVLENDVKDRIQRERQSVGYKVRKVFNRLTEREKIHESEIDQKQYEKDVTFIAQEYLQRALKGGITQENCQKYLSYGPKEKPQMAYEGSEFNLNGFEFKGKWISFDEKKAFGIAIKTRADEIARRISRGEKLDQVVVDGEITPEGRIEHPFVRKSPHDEIPEEFRRTKPAVAAQTEPVKPEVDSERDKKDQERDKKLSDLEKALRDEHDAREREKRDFVEAMEKQKKQFEEILRKSLEQERQRREDERKAAERLFANQLEGQRQQFENAMKMQMETLGKLMQLQSADFIKMLEGQREATDKQISLLSEAQVASAKALSEAMEAIKIAPKSADTVEPNQSANQSNKPTENSLKPDLDAMMQGTVGGPVLSEFENTSGEDLEDSGDKVGVME